MRNVLATVPQGTREAIAAIVRTIFGQPAFLPISNGYRIYYGVVIGASAGAANPNVKVLSGILSQG